MKKSRSLITYTVVSLLLVLLTWGVFKSAKHLFIEGDRFLLTEIQISPEPTPKSFINYLTLPKITGLDCGVSIFSYDLGNIKETLEQRPEIKSATLSRRLPGTILIEIKERQPVAKLTINGKKLIVDKDGYCFQSNLASDTLFNKLPSVIPLYGHDIPIEVETQQLTDIGLQRALHLIDTWNLYDVKERLLSVEVKNYHSLEALTEHGANLIFGYYEHERQIRDFCSLTSHSENTGQQILTANLLPFKNIPVIFNKIKLPKRLSPHHSNNPESRNDAPEEDVLLILEQG